MAWWLKLYDIIIDPRFEPTVGVTKCLYPAAPSKLRDVISFQLEILGRMCIM